MTRIAGLVIALAFVTLTPAALAQGPGAKSPLMGAWKVIQNQNGPVTDPGLYIFTARHYSRMGQDRSRAQFKDRANVTLEEKVAAFDTFAANTGSYQISGDTIVFDIVSAKVPNNVGRTDTKLSFKIDGMTLILTNEGNKNFIKLTRVE